jgi:tetratricopeptide (TPR) repeat protein
MLIGIWWVSFLPFFVAARYRAPIIPLLLGFSAFALYQLWTWSRTGNLRKAGFALGAGVLVFLLVNVNWAAYQIDRARWHYARGRGYSHSERWDAAAVEFRRTLELNPSFVSAHIDLGVLLAMKQQWNESYEHLWQAAQFEPDNPFARQNLAGVLEALGKLEEARTHFEAAAKLKPEWSKPRAGLQRIDQALAQRRRAAP